LLRPLEEVSATFDQKNTPIKVIDFISATNGSERFTDTSET
jgi:hypothetical protein